MKRIFFFVLMSFLFGYRSFAASFLHNDYAYLQDLTLELYTDDVAPYKVPEQMKSIEEILMFDVLHATWKNNSWTAYTLNKDLLGTFKVGQPALLDNGDTKQIFFIASFPGSVGGLDIYTSDYKNGKWSKPRNMGYDVNTSGNEANPGLLNDNTLTYSSNGIIKKLDLRTSTVVNLEESKPTPPPTPETPIVKSNTTPKEIITPTVTEPTTQVVTTVPSTPKVETIASTGSIKELGTQSRNTLLSKYHRAIQLGAFGNPKWEAIQPLSKYGEIISYKNENGVNVVWLVGYASRAAAEAVLPQVKATPGFENAYVTGN
ncbi:MAG: SPOR domain-containing protein [Bacteroidetes bacterium]|nr:SPOR domain-containing protein [Bacteroidota bacterium]